MTAPKNRWLEEVIKDGRLTATQKSVAAALWTFMDAGGCCWPSQQAIGDRAGISKRETVRLCVTALEAAGHLTRLLQPDGNRRPNRYIAAGPGISGEVVRLPAKRGAKVVRPPVQRGGRPPAKRGTTGPRETGHEPITNEPLRLVTPTDTVIADLLQGRTM